MTEVADPFKLFRVVKMMSSCEKLQRTNDWELNWQLKGSVDNCKSKIPAWTTFLPRSKSYPAAGRMQHRLKIISLILHLPGPWISYPIYVLQLSGNSCKINVLDLVLIHMVEKKPQNLKEEQALKPKPARENVWMIQSFPPSPSLMTVANMIQFIVTVLGSNHDHYILMMVKMQMSERLFFFFLLYIWSGE